MAILSYDLQERPATNTQSTPDAVSPTGSRKVKGERPFNGSIPPVSLQLQMLLMNLRLRSHLLHAYCLAYRLEHTTWSCKEVSSEHCFGTYVSTSSYGQLLCR